MLEHLLAVGGPRGPVRGNFDFVLPAYMLLTFLLALAVVGMRLSVVVAVLSFVGGTAWAWSAASIGTLPAAAIALLVALLAGWIRRRRGFPQTPTS